VSVNDYGLRAALAPRRLPLRGVGGVGHSEELLDGRQPAGDFWEASINLSNSVPSLSAFIAQVRGPGVNGFPGQSKQAPANCRIQRRPALLNVFESVTEPGNRLLSRPGAR